MSTDLGMGPAGRVGMLLLDPGAAFLALSSSSSRTALFFMMTNRRASRLWEMVFSEPLHFHVRYHQEKTYHHMVKQMKDSQKFLSALQRLPRCPAMTLGEASASGLLPLRWYVAWMLPMLAGPLSGMVCLGCDSTGLKESLGHTEEGDAGDCQHQVKEGKHADEVEAKRVIHHLEKGAVENPAKLCDQCFFPQLRPRQCAQIKQYAQ
jgi:hypothetical protein